MIHMILVVVFHHSSLHVYQCWFIPPFFHCISFTILHLRIRHHSCLFCSCCLYKLISFISPKRICSSPVLYFSLSCVSSSFFFSLFSTHHHHHLHHLLSSLHLCPLVVGSFVIGCQGETLPPPSSIHFPIRSICFHPSILLLYLH